MDGLNNAVGARMFVVIVLVVVVMVGMFSVDVYGNILPPSLNNADKVKDDDQPFSRPVVVVQPQSVGSPWPMPQVITTTPVTYTLADPTTFR